MRAFFAGLGILVSWTAFDAVMHRFLLAPLYRENVSLWRPFNQMSLALIVLVTAALIFVFIKTYTLLVRPKSLPAGLVLGAFMGLALGIASGFGTFVHMPIPPTLAWAWFAGGWLKGIAAGGIIGATIREKPLQEQERRAA